MYNPQLKWYNKKDVLNLFDIVERTYFRKLKKITSDIRIKTIKNKKGRNSTLIHYQDLDKVFKRQRKSTKPNDKEDERNFIGTLKWNYFGNIKPEKTLKSENIGKMKFIYSELKKLDKEIILFYHLEENPENKKYHHSHFLITTKLEPKIINDYLILISDNNYLQPYDYQTYHYRGSFYSNKFGKHDTKYYNPFVYWELLR